MSDYASLNTCPIIFKSLSILYVRAPETVIYPQLFTTQTKFLDFIAFSSLVNFRRLFLCQRRKNITEPRLLENHHNSTNR